MLHVTALLLSTMALAADGDVPVQPVAGRVVAAEAVAVEHARVSVVDGDAATFTDSAGYFSLDGCQRPCLLLVHHARFHDQAVEVTGDAELTVELAAKQTVFEHIEVTATRGVAGSFAPVSIASTVVTAEEQVAPPATLTELVEGVAGVAENGQGGIFQVFSIRGVSRHRVLTLVSGMPMIGERRAGVSVSFIDPTLMGTVDVLRGPASTYYGSGALGGVVQVFPQTFDDLSFEAGYSGFGDENYQRVGWGSDDGDGGGWSVGLARRSSSNDDAPNGEELNTHFTQVSAAVARSWKSGRRNYEILAIPTYGHDIGKSNSDFPGRTTDYPEETHLLLKFAVSAQQPGGPTAAAGAWSFQAFAHPNTLETEVLRQGDSLTLVENEAFDFGGSWQREWTRLGSGDLSARFGIDYLGRRGVDSRERAEDLSDGSVDEVSSLDGGTQDEAAAFGSLRWSWGETTLLAGTRLTWQRQQNAAEASRDDTAWTGFVGLVQPLVGGLELTANLGTGLRFPNLSERFFTGTTGRGTTIGNPDLEPESSINTDLGLRWYGSKLFLSGQVFHQSIDDYIERIDVADGTRTFVNLSSGTIVGFEVEGFYQLHDHWLLSWNGHLLDGEDGDGQPLADIPADRFQFGIKYSRGDWQAQLQHQFRDAKDDPGSGEVEVPSADLLSASLRYHLSEGLALTLRAKNLLDEEYFNSADDRAALSPGRSVGLALSWSGL